MPTLDSNLRDQLATVVGKENADGGARAVAEAGARAALSAMSVHLATPYAHLDAGQKQLRNRLRARARQLGDTLAADKSHGIDRLAEQTAYEHWHRMLFARFLAENDLLIHPEMRVAVTLDECAELAASEGAVDAWELAGRYASRMLPQIFRPDDPVLALKLAAEHQGALESLLSSLPSEVFRASDSLGWCYQFWQARKKKEVNTSEVKIGADELPAVTQLFTEPYMVQFLLHNTLGAWWVGAGRALPVEMPYLRVLDDGTPAAGTFEGWPHLTRDLKVLDPCCGSGHFLVAAFEMLVAFRMAEEGLTAREACDAALRDNLFGLELDARCVQIAAFALAMAAWTYPDAGGYRPLAPMNVACSGLAISGRREEWERLGGENARLRAGMGRMWELFSDAPVLGSLIDPKKDSPNPIQVARFEDLGPMLSKALVATPASAEEHEVAVAAKGLADAAAILGSSFDLVCTNVPYLHKAKHSDALKSYIASNFESYREDLAFAMMARCWSFTKARTGGTALVMPQNWLFLGRYKAGRKELLAESSLHLYARLGSGAFETISGEVVNVVLCVNEARTPGPTGLYSEIDVTDIATASQKALEISTRQLRSATQSTLARNADQRITLEAASSGSFLRDYAVALGGTTTGDSPRFRAFFWEVDRSTIGSRWLLQQMASSKVVHYSGRECVLFWKGSRTSLEREAELHGATIAGRGAWGKRGVVAQYTGSLPVTLYSGDIFENTSAVIVPKFEAHLPAIWCFCSSTEFNEQVRAIDKKFGVTCNTLAKVPFDLERWSEIAADRYPNGLPEPHSDAPDQWLFVGRPRSSVAPIHVAVARLLGYRWPDQQPDVLDGLSDSDGIVCIPALRGERPAADRLADLLAAAWGKEWHPQTLTDLLAAVGHKGTLEEWLRDAFFKQHCEMFHHRPFIWHVWDGHREGFSALVNYHKLDHERLKSLTYTYLGDWIRTQEIEAKAGKSGAGDKLAKAKALQQRLAAILEGEAPLDVFVRWKPIEEQPIGWHPDLDDGVRLNIRPFLSVQDVGAKGAGVLRWKPNVKWGVDRGKNPPDSPWGEDRDNDRHLTLVEKRAARGET
jgi:hypothetical protein